jgi:ATP-dependent protease ClpP protease subunit
MKFLLIILICYLSNFLNEGLKITSAFKKKLASSVLGISCLVSSNISPLYANAFPTPGNEITYVQSSGNNIYIYGSINPESTKLLKDAINDLTNNALRLKNEFHVTPPPINLHIQSEGGSFLHSLYIIDLIKSSPIPIDTYIDGYAASAATLISVVGHKRFISEHSLMLIHQLHGGNEGKFNELDDSMRNYNTFMEMIKSIYKENTNIDSNNLEEILNHDLWLNAKKCLDMGLVDEILK